jgi:hypothetical protein
MRVLFIRGENHNKHMCGEKPGVAPRFSPSTLFLCFYINHSILAVSNHCLRRTGGDGG